MPNEYSAAWQAVFGATVDPAATEREVEFLCRQLPLPAYRRVLDVACGQGRHIRALEARGCEVLGVERDPAVAPEGAVVLDMRDLWRLEQSFDAVVCMWQSFGYFDDETNLSVLRQMAELVRTGGRAVLDVYHRGFFERRGGGERTLERPGRTILERSELSGGRLRVELDTGDEFDWRLYTPEELAVLAPQAGLRLVVACTWWDESRPATPEEARMQLVLERDD